MLEDPARVASFSAADAATLLEDLRRFRAPLDALRASPLFARLDELAQALSTRLGSASPGHGTRYVTQAEAAAMFGVPLSTVRYLTRRGRVASLGRGKNRRLLPGDLARELEECQRTGRSLRPSGQARKKPLDGRYPDGIE